jgi:hypothetical protein
MVLVIVATAAGGQGEGGAEGGQPADPSIHGELRKVEWEGIGAPSQARTEPTRIFLNSSVFL